MQIKQGTSVYTADGDEIGSVDRVAINPRTKRVTHMVVRKGVLLPQDKVIPIDWVAEADQDRVMLSGEVASLDELPDFEEQHVVPVDEQDTGSVTTTAGYVPSFYWYPPVMGGVWGAPMGSEMAYGYPGQPWAVETEQNIPGNTVALREGARVVTADGENAGRVEQLVVNAESERARHFVVAEGLLFKERKLIPADWVDTVTEDEIRLAVDADVLKRLPEYKEE